MKSYSGRTYNVSLTAHVCFFTLTLKTDSTCVPLVCVRLVERVQPIKCLKFVLPKIHITYTTFVYNILTA